MDEKSKARSRRKSEQATKFKLKPNEAVNTHTHTHCEILHTLPVAKFLNLTFKNIGKNVKQLYCIYTASESINWYN